MTNVAYRMCGAHKLTIGNAKDFSVSKKQKFLTAFNLAFSKAPEMFHRLSLKDLEASDLILCFAERSGKVDAGFCLSASKDYRCVKLTAMFNIGTCRGLAGQLLEFALKSDFLLPNVETIEAFIRVLPDGCTNAIGARFFAKLHFAPVRLHEFEIFGDGRDAHLADHSGGTLKTYQSLELHGERSRILERLSQ